MECLFPTRTAAQRLVSYLFRSHWGENREWFEDVWNSKNKVIEIEASNGRLSEYRTIFIFVHCFGLFSD